MPARGLWAVQQTELARSASAQRPRAGIFRHFQSITFLLYIGYTIKRLKTENYPYFPINKLRLINLNSLFKTPKQSYSVSKNFSSKHRAVIFRHSSVVTTDKVLKYNEFTKLGMLLMHLHRMCNNQLIAMPDAELRFRHTSSPTFVQCCEIKDSAAALPCVDCTRTQTQFKIVCTGRWQSCSSFHSIRQLKLWLTRRFTYFWR